MERAEGICPPSVDPLGEGVALDGQESARVFVGFGARDIDFLVCGIEIAHHEHFFTGINAWLQHVAQLVVEIEFEGHAAVVAVFALAVGKVAIDDQQVADLDRKSTRLNSSHVAISYAVFCLKKKKK